MRAAVLLVLITVAALAPSWLLRLLERGLPEFRFEEGPLRRREEWPQLVSLATPRWWRP